MDLNNLSEQQFIDLFRKDYGFLMEDVNPIVADSERNFTERVEKWMTGDVDTYTYNPPSNGIPAWLTLVNIQKIIPQLLIKRAYMEIGEAYQQGDFTTTDIQFGVEGLTGEIEPYSDFGGTLRSDTNYTWPKRQVFSAQTHIQYGEREVATAAKANVALVTRKQFSAAQTIAIAQNKLFFFGNINSIGAFITQTFGLLNDPGLNPATPATAGGSASALWSVKANSPTGPQDMARDVLVTAYGVMQAQMGSTVSPTNQYILACSATAAANLNQPSQYYTQNAWNLIKQTLPNIRLVIAPEYKTIGAFQLIATDTMPENPVKDLFSYKLKAHALVTQESSWRQKWSFGSGGCGILQYAPIVTISGIETP